jgi:hypothetical protein
MFVRWGNPAGVATTLGGYVKRVLLVLALVLIVTAAAAPVALARQSGSCYLYDSELGAYRCLPSKKACEQVQASDPMALGPCIKENKIYR